MTETRPLGVLDASALLAYLLGEPGSEVVERCVPVIQATLTAVRLSAEGSGGRPCEASMAADTLRESALHEILTSSPVFR